MFFKIFILFLYINLAVNTVLGVSDDENTPDQTEEKILKDLYDDCIRWIGFQETDVSSGGFWMYMGKNNSDLNRILDYHTKNPDVPYGHLNLKHFGELFKHICNHRGITVKYWAAYRKARATLRTRDETALLHLDQTEDDSLRDSDDDAISSYTVRGKTEEEILEDSFDNCRRWLDKSEDNSISLSEFWVSMGKNEKDCDRISDFFIKNPEAHYRISEYYIDNPDVIQGPIDLKLYCDIFKHVCNKIGVSVREWAGYREIKTAARTPHEVILLPRGDHEKAL